MSLFRVLAVCGAVLLCCGGVFGQTERQDLVAGWTFMKGDDMAWKDEAPAERVPIEVNGAWEDSGHPGYDGMAWYFLEFEVPEAFAGLDLIELKLGRIDDADETFLNGVRVGGLGRIGGNGSAWESSRVYALEGGVLKAGVNRLAVRVSDHGGNGGMFDRPYLEGYDVVLLGVSTRSVGDRAMVSWPEGLDLDGYRVSPAYVMSPYGEAVEREGERLPEVVYVRRGDVVQAELAVDLEKVDLYGTGEVVGPFRRDGTFIKLWNTDSYAYGRDGGQRLYQSHPWVMGLREDGSAFGVIFDTTWRSSLDLKGGIRFDSESPAYPVYVFERETPEAVVEHLAEVTGRMALPPLWALGFHQSRYAYEDDAALRAVARAYRRRGLPADAIWLDIESMDGRRVFTFDPKRLPDPKATNDALHAMNFRTVWILNPGVKDEPDKGYEPFDTGTERDVWLRRGDGEVLKGRLWAGRSVWPDFTRPDVRAWWAERFPAFIGHGIDGVWNDMNEPGVNGYPDSMMPDDVQHGGGEGLPAGNHAEYHNIYGMLMGRASMEGMLKAQPEKRPFVLVRSSHLGGQRYAAMWTGDNLPTQEHLALSIRMSLNLGLSGQPFSGADVGAFDGRMEKKADLFGHWISVGAFYPFSRCHFAGRGNQPDREPWTYDDETENVARVALMRRYRLLPYLYTVFREASVTGLPVMRPVFFTDPAAARLREEGHVFLLGGDLLVVPRWVEEPALPEGDWRAIRVLDGDIEDDPFQVELRQRPGSIVPMGPVVQHTVGYELDELTVSVHFDAEGLAEGVLYEDAYDGFGYREGEYRVIRMRARRDEGGGVLLDMQVDEGDWELPERTVEVRVVGD